MKFIKTFFELLISLLVMLNLVFTQTGIEQQTIPMNIKTVNDNIICSADVKIKLVHNREEVDGHNKYIGYWVIEFDDSKRADQNKKKFDAMLGNFGQRLIGTNKLNLDFRYMKPAEYEIKEESSKFTIKIGAVSKESTINQDYFLEFTLPLEGNKKEAIQSYFDNIKEITKSSHEVVKIYKKYFEDVIRQNIKVKGVRQKKISLAKPEKRGGHKNKDKSKPKVPTGGTLSDDLTQKITNSTDSAKEKKEEATPDSELNKPTEVDPSKDFDQNEDGKKQVSEPKKELVKFSLDDITDSRNKIKLKELQNDIKKSTKKINDLKIQKEKLLKRANEMMDKIDKQNQQLNVLSPQDEMYKQRMQTSNDIISDSENKIKEIKQKNSKLATDLKDKTVKHKDIVKQIQDNTNMINNLKASVNDLNTKIDKTKQSIAELESKMSVSTDKLKTLEDKKKILLDKIDNSNKEVKSQEEDASNGKKDVDTLQTQFDNLTQEKKKVEGQIKQYKESIAKVKKAQNDVKKDIDPEAAGLMTSQKENTVKTLTKLEKYLQEKEESLMKSLDEKHAHIIKKAYEQIINKENFDPESYKDLLKQIPSFIWTVPK